jgi:hypothetical protein
MNHPGSIKNQSQDDLSIDKRRPFWMFKRENKIQIILCFLQNIYVFTRTDAKEIPT